ncbi:MAG: AgmX/PglI C-terminal domain-containing protein [Myxococcales bacterium]|nr:AgmX/PglI C-terminal domain-containing protein [Myxococcales bacterium]
MRLSLFVGVALSAILWSCAPALPPASSGGGEVENAERATSDAALAIDEARCRQGLGRLNPFVVTWDATARAELAAHAQQSLAVVKMSGCGLELLPACQVPGEYRFRATSGDLQSLDVQSRDELYAKLPLSVAQLTGRVGSDRALRLRYFVRGLYFATAPSLYRSQLRDGCEGATHLVLNYAAGAFELDVASGSARAAGVEALGAGAGARRQDERRAVFSGGKLGACSSSSECDAPVRLRLMPILGGDPPEDARHVAERATTKPALAEASAAARTREDIVETVRSAFPGFRACYEDLLGRAPTERRRVEAHFTIEPDGVVSKLDLVVTGGADASFTGCFREVLYNVRFAPAAKQATVVFPFEFSPG